MMIFLVSGLPPEYCEFAGKGNDLEKCKLWVKNTHPELYEQIWAPAEGEEEKKEGEPGKGGKKKKGVKFTEATNKKIKVVKQSRGGKKMVTSIWGLEEWGVDLTKTAQVMSKRFGTGAAATEIDYRGEKGQGILIQGDVTDRFDEFIE